jgi:hypothetical protein
MAVKDAVQSGSINEETISTLVSAVAEPRGGVVGGDGFESIRYGLILGFFGSRFGVAQEFLEL